MAITNHERVGKMLDLLCQGLFPFVERELKVHHQQNWLVETRRALGESQLRLPGTEEKPEWDAAAILAALWGQWNEVFRAVLGQAERSLVSELRDVRNRWAHQRPFSTDDTYRALDSAARLLTSISASQAGDLERMKMELLRVRFDEQVRSEKRRSAGSPIEGQVAAGLKPWREVVHPHPDVASGRYQQAEFAADLWQVHLGEGSNEYLNPIEFYRRTFLTESLTGLIIGALQRLSGLGGDPVVQLQTNFGGGKTHSMLALFHLFSGVNPSSLKGIEDLVKKSGVSSIPKVKRVALVGNKISPGNPVIKSDGTIVRTLWGELAWQLGGRKAYDRIQADDEKATSPGDVLRELFNEYGPCLILIDEWVAYARQLHDQSDLPAGSFETHFSFAQVLTESAKLAKQTLLVVSLPSSDFQGSPHNIVNDVEVGGERGRAALDRLRNAIGRIEASWRPASAEESFEIVRQRLFEPIVDQNQFVSRDTAAKAFFDLYRTQNQEFPTECRDSDYENRLRSAYPIHPEVFDRLFSDWSTLVKFQRTRGVLRLMASVIHSLWEKQDRNPLIMPSTIPIDDQRVQSELTRYLSDNWVPVIEKDVDGPNSLPLRMDGENRNFGAYSACRRAARTIFLGSAPIVKAANRGLEDKRVKLGCVMPGESPAIFGDALRRLSGEATYLYTDNARFWYDIQPTVTKLAEDRAEQLKSDPDSVVEEIRGRLVLNLKDRGDFHRVHSLPASNSDIPDEPETRLVVLGIEYPYTKGLESSAEMAAKSMLEYRGNSPRIYKNTLAFLAIDKNRLGDLDEVVRKFLAWDSIVAEADNLNLSPHQQRQAISQRDGASATANARLPEAYQWLLIPSQPTPQDNVEWLSYKLTGLDPLAVRAGRKLKTDDMLILQLGGSRLRIELDRIPLWRGDHVAIKQLVEDFARYIYLPRLRDSSVLIEAIRDGLRLLAWTQDSFAYAESYDEDTGRYRGLRIGQLVQLSSDNLFGMLVKPEPAMKQLEAEKSIDSTVASKYRNGVVDGANSSAAEGITIEEQAAHDEETPENTRFHGAIDLDPERVGRDAGRIADEVIAHLTGLVGADVNVSLEIQAKVPDGVPDDVVRTVLENCRTLKFSTQGFEKE